MKIMHVIDHTQAGGAQKVLYYLLQSLGERFDFAVVVLGAVGTFSDDYRSLGIPVYEVGKTAGRWSPAPVIQLIQLILRERPQIVHLHLFKSSILGALAALLTNRKVILHDHTGLYPTRIKAYISNRLLCSLYVCGFRSILHFCDRVLVLTQGIADEYLRTCSFILGRLFVLPNAVPDAEVAAKPAGQNIVDLRSELGLAPNACLVAMVGRLEPEKDWPTFLRIAQRLADRSECFFLVIGSGSLETCLRQEVETNKWGNIRMLGYRPDVTSLLRQVDVFVLTSKEEAFGLVVLEAMAAGCPVVITRSGAEYVLANGETGFVAEAGDDCQLAEFVCCLLDDANLRQRVAQQALEMVRKRYTWSIVSQRLADIYSEL